MVDSWNMRGDVAGTAGGDLLLHVAVGRFGAA